MNPFKDKFPLPDRYTRRICKHFAFIMTHVFMSSNVLDETTTNQLISDLENYLHIGVKTKEHEIIDPDFDLHFHAPRFYEFARAKDWQTCAYILHNVKHKLNIIKAEIASNV